MRLLIGGSSSKFFHLKNFADGYPSRKLSTWLKRNGKFKNLINDFKPDAVFVDRQRHFGLEALNNEVSLFVHLRGNYF